MGLRSNFRRYDADGHVVWFQPSTGRTVRADGPGTAGARRAAPRVLLFALSHACDLACGYCSRDRNVRDRWTTDEAFGLLADLAGAGSQEVCFGGGEPLLHPGFDSLVARLATETLLAVHATTNGTRLTSERAARLAPHLGELRFSTHDEGAWRTAIPTWVGAGGRAGANVLVRPNDLPGLSRQLRELADLGCSDVALLRYVGDGDGHLGDDDLQVLAEIVGASPLPVRLSTCFADRLPAVPRLFTGDCGAGGEFLTVGPDRTFAPCSFHGLRTSFTDAADLLVRWRRLHAPTLPTVGRTLHSAAGRLGCARPLEAANDPAPGVRLYRGFAANNSGDTVVVARFATVAKAAEVQRLLEAARETVEAGRELAAALGMEGFQDDVSEPVRAVGSALLATGYDVWDALPVLRQAAWEHGGSEVFSRVHCHHGPVVLAGVTGMSADAVRDTLPDARVRPYGRRVYALLDGHAGALDPLLAVAPRVSAEFVHPVHEEFGYARAPTTPPAPGGWMVFEFPKDGDGEGASARARFMAEVPGDHGDAEVLLVRAERPNRRLARRHRWGRPSWLPGDRIAVTGAFERGPTFDRVRAAVALRGAPSAWTWSERGSTGVSVRRVTDQPEAARDLLRAVARDLGVRVWIGVSAADPLADAFARVDADLTIGPETT